MDHQTVQNFNNQRYADDESNNPNDIRYKTIMGLVRKCSRLIQKKDGTPLKIIDVGCGPGHLTKFILEMGAEAWGCDISDSCIDLGRKKGLKMVKANLEEELPFQDESFDMVICSEVIEHIYDTESFVKELQRILKKGGYLILTTPNVASFGRRIMLLLGISPILDYKLGGTAGHIRYFTFKNIKSFLSELKFNIIDLKSDIVNFNSSGSFSSTLLAKLFRNFGRGIYLSAQK